MRRAAGPVLDFYDLRNAVAPIYAIGFATSQMVEQTPFPHSPSCRRPKAEVRNLGFYWQSMPLRTSPW